MNKLEEAISESSKEQAVVKKAFAELHLVIPTALFSGSGTLLQRDQRKW